MKTPSPTKGKLSEPYQCMFWCQWPPFFMGMFSSLNYSTTCFPPLRMMNVCQLGRCKHLCLIDILCLFSLLIFFRDKYRSRDCICVNAGGIGIDIPYPLKVQPWNRLHRELYHHSNKSACDFCVVWFLIFSINWYSFEWGYMTIANFLNWCLLLECEIVVRLEN